MDSIAQTHVVVLRMQKGHWKEKLLQTVMSVAAAAILGGLRLPNHALLSLVCVTSLCSVVTSDWAVFTSSTLLFSSPNIFLQWREYYK